MLIPDDTIAALATPAGCSALGIVRLNGTEALAIADRLFSSPRRATLVAASTHTLHHGYIIDDQTVIDEVLVGVLRGPRSATGEDMVEISAHGGRVVLERILRLCLARGARLANPGEFTLRAFLHGKLDLAQAEAVADLIASKTERAAEAALTLLSGGLSRRVQEFRARLIDLLSHLEVALDYAEEDIRFLEPSELHTALQSLQHNLTALQQTADKGRLLREGLRVAIIGRPNAGKSSLLNALLERERAIVTDIPGTTRDVLEELLDVRGIPIVISDTAGIRAHSSDPVERIGQERSHAALAAADVVLWVLDAAQPLAPEDRHIAALLADANKLPAAIILCNKCDRPQMLDDAALAALAPGTVPLRISALTRAGLDSLEDALVRRADITPGDETPIVNLRHRDALARTARALEEATATVKAGATEEIIAFHLREALNTLGEITGETTTEDVLQNIFSRFCVGK